MSLSPSLVNTLLVIVSVGGAVAINMVIAGLIVIAVVHDGTTASQVATTFETALTAAIAVVGSLVGSLLTGKIVHSAALSAQEAGKS